MKVTETQYLYLKHWYGLSAKSILQAYEKYEQVRTPSGFVVLHADRIATRFGGRDKETLRGVAKALINDGILEGSIDGVILRVANVVVSKIRRSPAIEPRIGARFRDSAGGKWSQLVAIHESEPVRGESAEARKLRTMPYELVTDGKSKRRTREQIVAAFRAAHRRGKVELAGAHAEDAPSTPSTLDVSKLASKTKKPRQAAGTAGHATKTRSARARAR